MRRIASLLLVAACLGIPSATGCSLPGWATSGAKDGSAVSGIVAPHERIAQLREQREQAGSMAPAAAERLAAQLAPQCADEEDPLIRAEIVRTLGALRSQTAQQALLAAAQDPSSKVRVAVCRAWADIGGETASSELARILSSDMDERVRFAAARGLGKAGGPHAVPALGAALEDRDPAMQYLAMESLKQVSGRDYGHDVRRWKQYVQGETPAGQEKNIAQRFLGIF